MSKEIEPIIFIKRRRKMILLAIILFPIALLLDLAKKS
nr:MAG TPA: hypothetical protein [Caudoviricetes sp.]